MGGGSSNDLPTKIRPQALHIAISHQTEGVLILAIKNLHAINAVRWLAVHKLLAIRQFIPHPVISLASVNGSRPMNHGGNVAVRLASLALRLNRNLCVSVASARPGSSAFRRAMQA